MSKNAQTTDTPNKAEKSITFKGFVDLLDKTRFLNDFSDAKQIPDVKKMADSLINEYKGADKPAYTIGVKNGQNEMVKMLESRGFIYDTPQNQTATTPVNHTNSWKEGYNKAINAIRNSIYGTKKMDIAIDKMPTSPIDKLEFQRGFKSALKDIVKELSKNTSIKPELGALPHSKSWATAYNQAKEAMGQIKNIDAKNPTIAEPKSADEVDQRKAGVITAIKDVFLKEKVQNNEIKPVRSPGGLRW